mgnify:CR=1 FL=1
MKKLTGILFAAAFSILSVSCISFKNTAYVEGTDDFTVIPVTSNSFGKILQWNGYELSMSSVKRDISQKTVFGVGKKSGTISQKGTFSRDGNEVFSTSIYRRIDGWVDEDEFSSTNFFDENFTIETGKNDTIFYLSAQDDGIMLQDSFIFSGTIEDNIRYGKLDATHDEVVGAARAAKSNRFIRTLPGAYDFPIGEDGGNVSQGQRQLLTIARAILANREMLILDEATSSVDTRTEARIQQAMDNLMEGRTSFVIAHRLSTIRNADLILVMNKGDIVEQGTHDELIAKNGFYADLYNAQFEEG